MRALCMCLLGTAICVSSVGAQDTTWNFGGSPSLDWGNDSNWTAGSPDADTANLLNAIIPTGGAGTGIINLNGDRQSANLTVGNTVTFQGGGLTVNGNASIRNQTFNNSFVMINGDLTVDSTSSTLTINADLTVTGTTSDPATANWLVTSGHTFTNQGIVNKSVTSDARDFLILGGALVNEGSFNVSGSNGNNTFAVNANGGDVGTFTNRGTITVTDQIMDVTAVNFVNDGGSINLVDGGVFNSSGPLDIGAATIGGRGTIDDSVVVNGGTINPGNSTGELIISGDLDLTGSTVNIEINGLNQGATADGYDFLNVSGNLNANGGANNTIDVAVSGFTLNDGDTFNIIAWGGALAGDLSNFDFNYSGVTGGSFSESIGGGNLTLTFNAVPEPGSLTLLGLAGIGLSFVRRRKS